VFQTGVKSLPQSRSLDLESYLIKPVQRVCKYPLLINDLLKTTYVSRFICCFSFKNNYFFLKKIFYIIWNNLNDRPKTDPNHELLAQAVESMRDVASHVTFY